MNQCQSPSEVVPPAACRFKRFIFAGIVFLLAGVGLVFLFHPSPPAVTVGPLPEGWPSPKPSLSARLEAAVPMWVWRVKEVLLGPPQPINIDAAIFSFKDWSESGVADLSLGKATFTGTNGVRVWLLPDSDLKALRQRLKQRPGSDLVSTPNINTAHRIDASLFVGHSVPIKGKQVQVGVVADFLPRVRRDSTDLTANITLSDTVPDPAQVLAIRTNLAVSARMQIPRGSGVFLLDAGPGATNRQRTGVIISASVPPPKK